IRACEPQAFHLQLDPILEHRQVPDPADRAVVDRGYCRPAPRTTPLLTCLWHQIEHQPALTTALFMSPLRNPISHPTTQLGNTIPVGHGRPQFVVLDTNKSARSAVRPSLRWEKNLFFCRRNRAYAASRSSSSRDSVATPWPCSAR